MRFGSLFMAAFSFAVYSFVVASAQKSGENNGPEIVATATFPETNAFHHVVNGEKNTLTVTVVNKSDRNVTLLNITGALLHPDTNAILRNLTSLKYGTPLLENAKVQLPYTFYSEYRPGDYRLNIWVEHATEGEKQRTEAYDSIITIVEPAISILDLKLLSTYAIVATFLGGLCYLAYSTFVPQTKKRSKKTPAVSVSSPVGAVTATGTGGYQEEWIPEHHLRKSKASKKQAGAASGTSGDELSPPETSGKEGKKRKGKK